MTKIIIENRVTFLTMLTAILLSTFISCNQIEKKDVTIIDDIVLGQPLDIYNKSLDDLKIKDESFLTRYYYFEKDIPYINQSYLKLRFTELFNYSNFQTPTVNHIGMLYPMKLEGTENIAGLVVLLMHTTNPCYISPTYNFIDITKEYGRRGIYQEINEELINRIVALYTSKYGTPINEIKNGNNFYYYIDNTEIVGHSVDKDNCGKSYLWETKAFTIRLFTGIKSHRTTYKNDTKSYNYYIDMTKPQVIKGSNEAQVFSCPFIEYELNPKAIEKLNLNKAKI